MGVIVVTGAFGALGRAVVADLLVREHRVVAIARTARGHSPATLVLDHVDLTDENAVQAAYRRVADEMGAIDGLVNVAGGFAWSTLANGDIDAWDRMYAINLRSAVASVRAALPYFASDGAIVNIGAAGAIAPGKGMAPYAASKAGVVALTESLADELRDRRIRVNAVLPTTLDTPANRADMSDADASRWVLPEAAARVIAFLLSSEAACVTGASIPLSLRGDA